MTKETPLTDVGRVQIIGELHRKATPERWLKHCYRAIFISRGTILHRWFTFMSPKGSEKKLKQNKTLHHKPALAANCTAVRGRHGQSSGEAHALVAGAPIFELICSTSCFRIMKANVRSPKRKARFTLITNMYLHSYLITIAQFSFQSFQTFILF